VTIRAKQENKTPLEVSNYYHEEFNECFKKLGFSYDVYTKTSSEDHKQFVKEFHEKLYESAYVYEKEAPQVYCDHCHTFLADRFVTGKCPECGKGTRGDQCDSCGTVLEPENLVEPICTICGHKISFRNTNHLYIAISKLENELKEFVDTHSNWRKNAIAFTNRYINEGLRDRALTRDLEWGIDVPKEGFEDKKIYIWAENVLGYLSASKIASSIRHEDINKIWGADAKHYYIHGKDNIPFHTIILPSLLIANGAGWHLPDEIVSSEYLTLEGRKISTSQNYAIWVKDIINRYDADSLRYYLLANGPEKKDADFSWREYVNSHNNELLGAYGNFVNRSLVFISKYLNGFVPEGDINSDINDKIDLLFVDTGRRIESGNIKEATDGIFEFVRYANRYFDFEQPWITRNTDVTVCNNTLYNCVQIIANLAVLLFPFLPFSSEKVFKWLNLESVWEKQFVLVGFHLPETQILFERIDKKIVEEEVDKLVSQGEKK
jgi:methionyl-tRNA synthetase